MQGFCAFFIIAQQNYKKTMKSVWFKLVQMTMSNEKQAPNDFDACCG